MVELLELFAKVVGQSKEWIWISGGLDENRPQPIDRMNETRCVRTMTIAKMIWVAHANERDLSAKCNESGQETGASNEKRTAFGNGAFSFEKAHSSAVAVPFSCRVENRSGR